MPGTGGYSPVALYPARPRLALVARCLRAWPTEVVGTVECGRFAYYQARPRLALVARCQFAWSSGFVGCLKVTSIAGISVILKCAPSNRMLGTGGYSRAALYLARPRLGFRWPVGSFLDRFS